MITAEDFLRYKSNINEDKNCVEYLKDSEVEDIMIEFAKLHVEEIQKLQKSKYYAGESGYIKEEEFIEILNDIK